MNEILQRKTRQYLVHSFLYYQLGESIISDYQYDIICNEILKCFRNNHQDYLLPYKDILTTSLSEDASGFSIRKFPAEIISSAMHLLYQHNYCKSLSFEDFLARFGYNLIEIQNNA